MQQYKNVSGVQIVYFNVFMHFVHLIFGVILRNRLIRYLELLAFITKVLMLLNKFLF